VKLDISRWHGTLHRSPASRLPANVSQGSAHGGLHHGAEWYVIHCYIHRLRLTGALGFCGVMSVFSSLRYCVQNDPTDHTNLYLALGFIPLGLFFDFMDGKVARWRKKASLMGQELDSLADLVSFGVSPAAAAFSLGLRTPLDHLLLTFFVLCGLTRLARFNVTVALLPKDATGKSKYFEGTPIPTSLAEASLMAYWVWNGWTHGNVPLGTVGSGLFEVHPVVLIWVLHGCLMVSKTIHIPKP
jgi:CDP-diacylglycerol---serine O-phosphatidyltransferase